MAFGAATAVVRTGIRPGALVSPLALGVVADQCSLRSAWMLPFGFTAIAAVLMLMPVLVDTRSNSVWSLSALTRGAFAYRATQSLKY